VGTPEGTNTMAMSRLCFRKTLVGTGWTISVILCMNWLGKQPVGSQFVAVKLFSQSG